MINNLGNAYSELLTNHAKRNIAFHVRACLHRGRSLGETLGQIYRDWGCREQVTLFTTLEFEKGL